MLSNRAKNLKSSPTLALVAKAKELTQKGHPVISLTVGEPDWPTYSVAAEEGINAIKTGFTKYTAANGTIELRQAIAVRTREDLGLTYSAANEIAVTSGAKFAIFACLQVLCDKGDEVIIPSPYWVSYPAMAELADATPKIILCDESVGFKLTPELLRKNINQNTKVFLFCSPSNPTGFCYSEEELRALAKVLKEFPRVCIISDDMYNRLLFNREKTASHILQVAPELKDRTIVINGGSKAYSMTGWRIGWACGPAPVIKAVGDYASQATGAPSSIAQKAAEKALLNCEADIVKTNTLLADRLESALSEISKIKEFHAYKPDGAFYLWVNVQKTLNKKYKDKTVATSAQFCEILLNDFFVATVPGEEFGHQGFMRLSFATDIKKMNEALGRMAQLIKEMT
jgi:aspartate aminotransferase